MHRVVLRAVARQAGLQVERDLRAGVPGAAVRRAAAVERVRDQTVGLPLAADALEARARGRAAARAGQGEAGRDPAITAGGPEASPVRDERAHF